MVCSMVSHCLRSKLRRRALLGAAALRGCVRALRCVCSSHSAGATPGIPHADPSFTFRTACVPLYLQGFGLVEVHRNSFQGTTSLAFNTSLQRYITVNTGLIHFTLHGVPQEELDARLLATPGFDNTHYLAKNDVDAHYRVTELLASSVLDCYTSDGKRDLTSADCVSSAIWSNKVSKATGEQLVW